MSDTSRLDEPLSDEEEAELASLEDLLEAE